MMSLCLPSKTLKKRAVQDKGASNHINIMGHYDDETLIDIDGKLMRFFRLDGVDATVQETWQIDAFKNRRNSVWKNFSSDFAIYSWTIRRKTAVYPDGEPLQHYAKHINDSYKSKVQETALFHSSLYLCLVAKPPEGKLQKTLHWFKRLSHRANKSLFDQAIAQKSIALNEASDRLLSTFEPYGITALGKIERHGKYFSEPLEFLGELINGSYRHYPFVKAGANQLLPQTRLFFNHRTGTIEFRNASGQKRYGAVVSIKEYADFTLAGLLDELNTLPYEFVLTQSFRFYDREGSKAVLTNQQKDLAQTNDASVSQTVELTDALDDAASGDVGYGIHHLTILCLSDELTSLNKAISDTSSALSKLDIISVREDLTAECSFWAQLPGNFPYTPRPAPISTRNFAGFASFHNSVVGRIKGNHWGDAVTVFETLSCSPYYFNFHFKDVGNTLIFGSMGTGKTVLKGFLLALSMKFGGKRIVFDKDRGLEILIRALGGHYELLTPGKPTGFNPCLLEDTQANRAFLAALFKKILTTHSLDWNEEDSETVEKVIDLMYTLPIEDRRFCHIAPYFGTRKKASLRARFDEWHSEGNKAWLFDNATDTLNFGPDIVGFELGQLLKETEVKTPACMYLMHRANMALDGQRGAIFIDEGWILLEDEYFEAQINDLGRTPRKKNRFLCLSTQSADDAVKTAVSTPLLESAACKIFFPNPAAKHGVYVDGLGLSEREFELIKTLEDDKNFFLLNFGTGKESVVVRANLTGLDDILNVISGRTETVLILDELRKHVGDDPEVWLPIFHDILRQRNALRRSAGDSPAKWVNHFFEHWSKP